MMSKIIKRSSPSWKMLLISKLQEVFNSTHYTSRIWCSVREKHIRITPIFPPYILSIRGWVQTKKILAFLFFNQQNKRGQAHLISVFNPLNVHWINREIVDFRTAYIFIRDTAYFHYDSLNYGSHIIEQHWKHAVSRMKMHAVRESTTSLLSLNINPPI